MNSNFDNSLRLKFIQERFWTERTIPIVTHDKMAYSTPLRSLLSSFVKIVVLIFVRNISLELDFGISRTFLVETLFLVGLTFIKISIPWTNFQFFSLGENVLLTGKYLGAYPGQIWLGMRCFQVLQV